MIDHNLIRHCTVTYPVAAATAGKGDTLTSSAIDTLGAAAVLIGVKFGTITATGKGTIKLQHSSDDGATDAYADVAGSAYSYTAATDSTKCVVLDVYRPAKRYLKVVNVRDADANIVVENGFAILYHQETQPVPGTTVTGLKVLNQPQSGTA